MPAVEGDLAQVGVPAVFRAVANEARTGCLTISRADAEARIYFHDGLAYHARMTGSGVKLGTRLISAGHLSEDNLRKALEVQKSEPEHRRLGEILIERGFVKQSQMEAIVRQQIEDTIFEILRWEGGSFRFDAGLQSDEDVGVLMNVENLVMGGARRFREWHQITRLVPTLEAIPKFREDEEDTIELALTPEEWALVSQVDGTSTIAQLAPECGFTELEAARAVYGLVNAGLLELELPEGVVLPPRDPELEKVFDELEAALEEATIREGDEAAAEIDEVAGEVPAGIGWEFDEEPMSMPSLESVAVAEDFETQGEEDFVMPGPDQIPTGVSPLDDAASEEDEPVPAPVLRQEDVLIPASELSPEDEPIPAPMLHEELLEHAGAENGQAEAVPLEAVVLPQETEAPAEAEHGRVIAEEGSYTGLEAASLFAELTHRPNRGSESREAPRPAAEPAKPASESQAEAPPVSEEDQLTSEQRVRKPVDPSIDTTALLREFTGLVGGPKSETEATEKPAEAGSDKSRGIFGRKRK
ncbi:MAG TPA: DUF4388 domain-containing protein [Actinomycetota bacterium]|nr:DUF4388 domain-containing protein [Actinomycetota bacterium]